MTTQLDSSIGLKKETVYGTSVTVDSFLEFTEEDFDWQPEFVQGQGLRVGKRVDRADRRGLAKEMAGGSVTIEARTKGMGKLIEALLGAGTSTLVSGSAYQQLFTLVGTDYLPSYTIQKGVPTIGGAAPNTQNFTGMMCTGMEMSAALGAVPTFKFNFTGKSMTTGVAYAAPSYPTNDELFYFKDGSIKIGGTPTVPTTTALATGGTTVANITDFDLTVENGLDEGGFTFGGAGQRTRKQAVGATPISGNITAEYTDEVLRDAFRNQTSLAIVLTFVCPTVISGGNYPTIQIVIPVVRLEGEMPKAVSAGGGVITQSIPFVGLDGAVAASPIYVAIVTAETAI